MFRDLEATYILNETSMARFRLLRIVVGAAVIVLLVLGVGGWYCVLRPAVRAKRALQQAAATAMTPSYFPDLLA
jgi:hypothetical protein